MNIIESILAVIAALSSGSIIGIFFEKRKRKAETQIIEADVNDKMREMYLKFVNDYDKKYDALRAELEDLRVQYNILKKQNEELRKAVRYNQIKQQGQ